MSLNDRPVPQRRLRISLPRELTREQQTALRNIRATEEARETDPSIYHVQEVDPELHRYPTPEELKRLHEAAEVWRKDVQRMIEEQRQNAPD